MYLFLLRFLRNARRGVLEVLEFTMNYGEVFQIYGLKKLKVLEGIVHIDGAPLLAGQSMVTTKGKPVSVEAKASSKLYIDTIQGGKVDKIGFAFPKDRKKILQLILDSKKPIKVMIIGKVDSGKSTLITYLANTIFAAGLKVAIIDLDVGQSNIGPPTTIGMGILEKPVLSLDKIDPKEIYFVGSTSPQRHLLRAIVGLERLLSKAIEEAEVVLIDTTGWILGGAARAYKTAKIDMIQPHIIVALQHKDEIEHVIRPYEYTKIRIIRAAVSDKIRPRSAIVRRSLRMELFRRYFANSKVRTIPIESLGKTYSLFGTGKPAAEEVVEMLRRILKVKVLYCEQSKNGIFIVKARDERYDKTSLPTLKELFGVCEIRIVSQGSENGIIVGLLDHNGSLKGLGIIQRIVYETGELELKTPVEGKISQMQFGSLRIDSADEELTEKL
ncbi:MAG: Clp1/GlmU family protein [Candidatus Hodarchaeota archaeon]